MKLVQDIKLAHWLKSLKVSSESFQWDKGNSEKNQKHRVSSVEVEELFYSPFVLGGKIIEPAHEEDRWILFGQTLKGRRLSLIFTLRQDLIRPISCRAMRKGEKAVYEEII